METGLTSRVRINVRGTNFEIENDILQKVPLSKLAMLCRQLPSDEVAFFNRDPYIFTNILNFYVTGHLHFPKHLCLDSIGDEMAFWELDLYNQVAPCCWNPVSEAYESIPKKIEWKKDEDSTWSTGSRRMWHRFFEFANSSWKALIWANFVLMNIIISIVTLLIPLEPIYKHYRFVNGSDEDTVPFDNQFEHDTVITIKVFDFLSFGILLFDYVIRLALAQRKGAFFKQALNIIDLLALIFWLISAILALLSWLIPANFIVLNYLNLQIIVAALNLVRVLRLFRLVRICRSIELLLRTIWASVIDLLISAFLLTICVLLYGVFVYFAEIDRKRSHFRSPLDGMWYAVITLTTVGYGDVTPLNRYGKIVGTLCAMTGLLLLALPIPSLVYNFRKYRLQLSETKRMERRREQTRVG